MKMFIRNDERFYNMTKRQSTFLCIMTIVGSHKNIAKKPTFLCIMTGYKKVTKLLRKGYKSYKVVISISLWRSAGVCRTGAGVCPQWRSVPVYTSKGAAFGELGAAFGGAGSCVRRRGQLRFKGSYALKGATFKRSVAAVGAITLDY